MKTLPFAKFFSLLALAGSIVPAVLYAFHLLSDDAMKATLLGATVVWFVAAPFWLKGGDH